MAGVKLSPDAKARLKLLVGFHRGYYPSDAIDRDTVIDWAISSYEPRDCWVTWNGKNYALQHRNCGFVAVRATTMLRHLRQGCEGTGLTLDIEALAAPNQAGKGDAGAETLGRAGDEFTLDMDEGTESSPASHEGVLADPNLAGSVERHSPSDPTR